MRNIKFFWTFLFLMALVCFACSAEKSKNIEPFGFGDNQFSTKTTNQKINLTKLSCSSCDDESEEEKKEEETEGRESFRNNIDDIEDEEMGGA